MGYRDSHRYGPLLLIAVLKLLKAALLLVVAAGALRLVHHDVLEVVLRWAHEVRVDPGNRFVHDAIARLSGVSDRRLEEIALGTFLYAALFSAEGIGLMLRRLWAEYLTVISTALLLPLEIYELVHRPTVARALILIANVAVVIYLIARLKSVRRERKASAASAASAASGESGPA
jgi:uncharacterized membrane protein (DUF2068 family)